MLDLLNIKDFLVNCFIKIFFQDFQNIIPNTSINVKKKGYSIKNDENMKN